MSADTATKSNNLLHAQVPGVYGEGDQEWWTILPTSLIAFLNKRLSGRHAMLVLALRNAAAKDSGYTYAQITDDELAEKAGTNPKEILRTRQDPKFRSLVDVVVGEKRSRGSRGRACEYDLTPLLRQFREWRRLRELGNVPKGDVPKGDETMIRAIAMARLSRPEGASLMETREWWNSLSPQVIDEALDACDNDPLYAARKLVEENREGGKEALDAYLQDAPVAEAA